MRGCWIFQGTVYESFEERQRAEKEFAILMGDIDPASVTAEQLQEAKKRFDEHTEFGSAVRKKAGEILIECGQKLLGAQIDDYIMNHYGHVETSDFSAENSQKLQAIVDDVYQIFGGRDVSSPKLREIQQTIMMSNHFHAVSQKKKKSTTVSASAALVTTAIWGVIGIVGLLLNHFIVPWFILRAFLFIAIITGVGEKIKEGWEDVGRTIQHNQEIDDAKDHIQ